MYVVLWVSGLPKTFGNTQPSGKSQLLMYIGEFVAAPFVAIPLVKKKYGDCICSVCAACIGLLICTGLERIHVKSSFKLSGCSVDHICVAFYFGRLLRS